MLAYNLSPSFNWDTTGMTDEQMKRFPEELGKLGFVFNFITYGGHQIDGLAAEEFARALRQDGMLSLAQLAAQDSACWNRPIARLRHWSVARGWMPRSWRPQDARQRPRPWARDRPSISIWCKPKFRPSCWRNGSSSGRSRTNCLRITACNCGRWRQAPTSWNSASGTAPATKAANLIFADFRIATAHKLLSIRDMNTFDGSLRKKRLMTLAHLFVIHRYKAGLVHYLSPTEDNQHQAQKMKRLGIFSKVDTEAALIIVASVDAAASPNC